MSSIYFFVTTSGKNIVSMQEQCSMNTQNKYTFWMVLAFVGTTAWAVASTATNGEQPGQSPVSTWRLDPVHSSITFKIKHLGFTWVHGSFAQPKGMLLYHERDISKSSVVIEIPVASINTNNQARDDHLLADDFFGLYDTKDPKTRQSMVQQGKKRLAEIKRTLSRIRNKENNKRKHFDLIKNLRSEKTEIKRRIKDRTHILFKSTAISWINKPLNAMVKEPTLKICGDLSIRGVSRQQCFTGSLAGPALNRFDKMSMGFDADVLKISRADYNFGNVYKDDGPKNKNSLLKKIGNTISRAQYAVIGDTVSIDADLQLHKKP